MMDRSLLSVSAIVYLLVAVFGPTSIVSESSQRNKRVPLWNATNTDRLKKDLLTGYDKFARPTNHSNVTPVDFTFEVTHIHIEESKFMMTMSVFVTLTWKDDKLSWNPGDYGGITKLHVADHEVWDPDLYIMNSAVGNNIGNAMCFVYNDGIVKWRPPAQFSTFCELDLSKWPFDRHSCSISVGSLAYYDVVNFTGNTQPNYNSDWSVKSEWRISHVKTIESDNTIKYEITVERYGAAYVTTIVLPALAVVLITLATFWLPPLAHERFVLGSVTLLLLSINLAFISHKLPFMGANTPLIVVFSAVHLVMAGVSILISVVSFNLSSTKRSMPWYLQSAINGPWVAYLGLNLPSSKGRFSEESNAAGEELRGYGYDVGVRGDERRILEDSVFGDERDAGSRDTNRNRDGSCRQWFALAVMINRLAFLLYVVIFLSLGLRAACS
ncbi:acetylcholine receptor subunit [Nesidiocoris tenuis]|uniref:Acetylcholine receptor subunit n=1 Tax=Nesidiocoris tenuis TaxID=355587 RepID=A0ABN7A6D1_9HEMI|nr:acetylcholine receptor subunit [Nesidiocoris tenuis]